MNCNQAETLVGAYADGEVDALRSFSLKRHLTGCGQVHRELRRDPCAAGADPLGGAAIQRPAGAAARVRAMASAVRGGRDAPHSTIP